MSSRSGITNEMQEGLGSPQATVCLTGRLTKRRPGMSLDGYADNLLFNIANSWPILSEEAKSRSWRLSMKVGHEAELVAVKEKSSVESAMSHYSTGQVLFDASVGLSPGLDEQGLCGFVSLPTSHIFLKEGEIAKPLVQALVKSQVCTLGLLWSDAVKHLDALLANLHFSSPLRHFFFFTKHDDGADVKKNGEADAGDMHRILQAFKKMSFLPDGVIFYDVIPPGLVSAWLPELCNLSTFLGIHAATDIRTKVRRFLPSLALKVKHLLVGGFLYECPELIWAVRQHPNWTITRLDLRSFQFDALDALHALLLAIAKNESITDLGLPLSLHQDTMALFLASQLHTRLLSLRLHFPPNEKCWQQLLLQALTTDSRSTVQFLDCHFPDSSCFPHSSTTFPDIVWSSLIQNSALTTLTALSLSFHTSLFHSKSSRFAEYLRSFSGRLIYLEVRGKCDEMDEWECANALTNNYSLCTFAFPWQNKAAKARAASFIRRNNLYSAGQFFKEDHVQPITAKLFLCGHAEAGKTTLCQALQHRVQHPSPLRSLSSKWCLNPKPKRTRGMEFHSLTFEHIDKKLLICDLAGQEEFHVFHHYFMNANSNDLFLVVCKVDDASFQQEFERQLDYWLRFIVSHRSVRNNSASRTSTADPRTTADRSHSEIKPKVIVVVNYFGRRRARDARRITTHDWSHTVMEKFSAVLDFGGHVLEEIRISRFKNLFGLNAKTGHGVDGLKSELDSLFRDFTRTAWPIPKLCYDISAKLIKEDDQSSSWLWPRIRNLIRSQRDSSLLTSYSAVLRMLSDESRAGIESTRIQAALQELHNQGFVVFFPSEEMNGSTTSSTLVITSTSWFCNKLVGSLLGTHLEDEPKRHCAWVWSEEEIKKMLRAQRCDETHLEEILRYLQCLELCTSLDIEPEQRKGLLLFPALVKQKTIRYPVVTSAQDAMPIFFGRRLRCTDSSIHLIPFGVFTRLQVKLHKKYGDKNRTFVLGYGWVSFMRGNIGVVVRFGGDVLHEAWESKQWIDILTFHAADNAKHMQSPMDNPSFIAVNKVMDKIRTLIFATCMGSEIGGIPTVMLEECVLHSKNPNSPTNSLSSLLEKVRKKGLQESYQKWALDIPPTPALNSLLPKEIEDCVKRWFQDLAIIADEFSLNVQSDSENITEGQEMQELGGPQYGASSAEFEGEKQEEESAVLRPSEQAGDGENQQSDDQFQELILSEIRRTKVEIKSYMKSEFRSFGRRQETMFGRLDSSLQMIREDIRKLGDVLDEARREIIMNCSTRLLVHELKKDRAYPVYPFLLDVKGRLAPLKALVGKRTVVHFMCESPTDGPHPVEGQKGKEVTLEVKRWVVKLARVMVPALRIICCLARVAATVYLPGAQVCVPTPEALVSGLGLEKDALQQVILPRALEALVAQLPDVDPASFSEKQQQGEEEVKEVMEAVFQNVEMDMASDFKLHRVCFDHVTAHTYWVCERHVPKEKGNRLRPISNPFKQ